MRSCSERSNHDGISVSGGGSNSTSPRWASSMRSMRNCLGSVSLSSRPWKYQCPHLQYTRCGELRRARGVGAPWGGGFLEGDRPALFGEREYLAQDLEVPLLAERRHQRVPATWARWSRTPPPSGGGSSTTAAPRNASSRV